MEHYRDFEPTFGDIEMWTLPRILRERARTHGDRGFLELPFQDRGYSFIEALGLSETIAAGFVRAGLAHGDRLVIMAANRAEYVLAWFGSAFAGLVEVPMNTAYRGSFLEHQVRTTAPRALGDRRAVRGSLPRWFGRIRDDRTGLDLRRRPGGRRGDRRGSQERASSRAVRCASRRPSPRHCRASASATSRPSSSRPERPACRRA